MKKKNNTCPTPFSEKRTGADFTLFILYWTSHNLRKTRCEEKRTVRPSTLFVSLEAQVSYKTEEAGS